MRGVSGLALILGGGILAYWILFRGGVASLGAAQSQGAGIVAVGAAGSNIVNTIASGGAGGGGSKTA